MSGMVEFREKTKMKEHISLSLKKKMFSFSLIQVVVHAVKCISTLLLCRVLNRGNQYF